MIVVVATGDMGPAAMIAFWVVVGLVGLACLVGVLCLIFPSVGRFLRSVKF